MQQHKLHIAAQQMLLSSYFAGPHLLKELHSKINNAGRDMCAHVSSLVRRKGNKSALCSNRCSAISKASAVGQKVCGGNARQSTCRCIHASLLEELFPDSSQAFSLLLSLASQQLALPLQLGAPLQSLCLSPLSVLLLLPLVLLALTLLLFFLYMSARSEASMAGAWDVVLTSPASSPSRQGTICSTVHQHWQHTNHSIAWRYE